MRAKKNSKKIFTILTVVIVLCIALMCFLIVPNKYINLKTLHHGDASKVQIIEKDSSLYTQDDIRSCVEIVESDFEKGWKGCALKELYYAGDEESKSETEYRNAPTLVLYSTIQTYAFSSQSSMNAPYVYEEFKWILTRDENGQWKHIDHGYG